jgi:hypothetical protein
MGFPEMVTITSPLLPLSTPSDSHSIRKSEFISAPPDQATRYWEEERIKSETLNSDTTSYILEDDFPTKVCGNQLKLQWIIELAIRQC